MIMRITRPELIRLAESFDDETKQYCLNDCIPTWDNKRLWDSASPYVLQVDDNIVSVIFANILNHSCASKIIYIQRLFTPKQYRTQGHFTELLTQVYTTAFDFGCGFMQLFYKPDLHIYKKLNFMPLFTTLEGYEYCLQPMLCADMKHNNQIVMLNKNCNFYNESASNHIDIIKQKYA